MYKIINKIEFVEVKIEYCIDCPYFNNSKCLLLNKELPYVYKFPIPEDCPLN